MFERKGEIIIEKTDDISEDELMEKALDNNAKDFVARWETDNGPYGIEKVIQGAKTESVPLGELKRLAENRDLLFDQELFSFTMGNAITMEDTNGNRKLLKKRHEQKIDSVAALIDAWVAYKNNRDSFE